MPRHGRLRDLEDVGQVAHAEFARAVEDVEDAQARLVAGGVEVGSQRHELVVRVRFGAKPVQQIGLAVGLDAVLVVDVFPYASGRRRAPGLNTFSLGPMPWPHMGSRELRVTSTDECVQALETQRG